MVFGNRKPHNNQNPKNEPDNTKPQNFKNVTTEKLSTKNSNRKTAKPLRLNQGEDHMFIETM